jgi:hypothetical protein
MMPGRFALTLLMFAVSPFELSSGMATGYGKLFPVLHLSPAAFAASQLPAGDPLDQTECLTPAGTTEGGCMAQITVQSFHVPPAVLPSPSLAFGALAAAAL